MSLEEYNKFSTLKLLENLVFYFGEKKKTEI